MVNKYVCVYCDKNSPCVLYSPLKPQFCPEDGTQICGWEKCTHQDHRNVNTNIKEGEQNG